MAKGAVEDPSAFGAPGLGGAPAEMLSLVCLVLVAPASPAEAFGKNIFRIPATFTHPTAERMVPLAGVRVANFTVGHCRND